MRDDTTYFYARAETELELAQRATHPEAVRAHYIIANHYLDRCYGGSDAATGGDGAPDEAASDHKGAAAGDAPER
jgi:hypothetical protein